MDNEYTSFKNSTERDEFLKKYKLLSQNPRKEKIYYYEGRYVSEPTMCSILGYYREYSGSATLVIDYGQGPHFILSDYLKQMQSSTFDVNSIEEV